MTIRRLTLSDLAFGEPLRWDVFGPSKAAAPVLHKGQVIAPSPQLEGSPACTPCATASKRALSWPSSGARWTSRPKNC
jgi:hypothetical protein